MYVVLVTLLLDQMELASVVLYWPSQCLSAENGVEIRKEDARSALDMENDLIRQQSKSLFSCGPFARPKEESGVTVYASLEPRS